MPPALTDSMVISYECLFWGVLLSTALFGITVVQTWLYMHRNKDGWAVRSLVALLISLDFAAVVVVVDLGRYNFITNFGNPEALLVLPKFVTIESYLMVTIVFLVQLVFSARVYSMTHKAWVSQLVILPVVISAFVVGIYLSVKLTLTDSMIVFTYRNTKIDLSLHAGLSALSDIFATFFLSRAVTVKPVYRESTRKMLKRLVIYIVTRGFLVSVVQTATLVAYLAEPNQLYWTPFHFCMSRIYVITMIAMLNARQEISAIGQKSTNGLGVTATNQPRSVLAFAPQPSSTFSSEVTDISIEAHVQNSHQTLVCEKCQNDLV
ncbi:hypothetical protein C8J56DRAFT_1022152 [Mycena floridula]|nr:hypothetical protein C8J56DRAFT_1022152 [Mycena floridula]